MNYYDLILIALTLSMLTTSKQLFTEVEGNSARIFTETQIVLAYIRTKQKDRKSSKNTLKQFCIIWLICNETNF